VHTGEIIKHRKRGDHCPRCGAPMQRATVGGRTTWFCSAEQA
jgi:formamidopyrimidine-DNA glycosylase